jgi:hypothetical protein
MMTSQTFVICPVLSAGLNWPACSEILISGTERTMAAKKNKKDKPLEGKALVKEVCRRIRVARSYWNAHNNRACRGEREKAMALYQTLTKEQREQVPQALRVWLRYRSEKYFGEHRTKPGSKRK